MKTKEFRTRFSDIFIIVFSDFHIGDKGFTEKSKQKVKGYIKWVKNKPNAFAILNGDILNVATRHSRSSPFSQNLPLEEQIDTAVELLKPIKNKIIGAIDGNHCQRLKDYVGYSPLITICNRLDIDYLGDSAVYFLRLGLRKSQGRMAPRMTFTLYAHHTSGGGRSLGSKMNRIAMLREIISNADCYVGSHNHQLGVIHDATLIANPTTGKVEEVRQMIVDSGGYLEWSNTYAEKMMLSPVKIGSPKIHFIIKKEYANNTYTVHKDIHVSL